MASGPEKADPPRRVASLQVNQPRSHFAVATRSGFFTYEIATLKPFIWSVQLFGYERISMCGKTNVVILVPSTGEGHSPSSMIQFWNDLKAAETKTINVGKPVLGVVTSRLLTAAITHNSVHIYNIATFQFYGTIETVDNPHEVGDIVWSDVRRVVACLGETVGSIRIYYVDHDKSVIIAAHTRPIAIIKLSDDGRMVATASEKGTVIRVFDTELGTLLGEYRRGMNHAEIHSIAFHPTGRYLLAASSKGTIHVYSLDKPRQAVTGIEPSSKAPANTVSYFKNFPLMPVYFQSEWSFCQYHVPCEDNSDGKPHRIVCTFSECGRDVIALTDTGLIYNYPFVEDVVPGAMFEPITRKYPV